MKDGLRNAFIEIFESKGKVSHKRVVTLVSTLLLAVTCLAIWIYGETSDYLYLVAALIGFISTLVGVTAVADNRSKRIEKENESKPMSEDEIG